MTAPNSITVKALTLITSAMQEIGALAPGEQPSNEDSTWVMQKLQRLIDQYNARETMVYNVDFTVYTLIANHAPHTIGPGGDFDTDQRPVSIPSIGLILQGTPGVEVPMNYRDQDWWAANTIKGLTSTLPTDFYYSPAWPLGEINFWPIPTVVNQVRVQSRLVLSEITSTGQNFSMPPAYWDLVIYDLADSIGPSFERASTPDLLRRLQMARKAVEVNNIWSPRLATDAPSQDGPNQARPDFNFLTGLSR